MLINYNQCVESYKNDYRIKKDEATTSTTQEKHLSFFDKLLKFFHLK